MFPEDVLYISHDKVTKAYVQLEDYQHEKYVNPTE